MLHSKPMIDEAVKYCKDAGVERCIGIILSPQFSSFIMEGYKKVFTSAALACGFLEDAIAVCGPWPTEPDFIELLTRRVVEAVARIKASDLEILRPIPVVFTTHSLPKRVVEKDPAYLDQLKRTTDAVLARLKASGMEQSVDFTYYSAYQSAGHTPEEWLKPDLTDILAGLAGQGVSKTNPSEAAGANDSVIGTKKEQVLIVPIQFLTDHLEILYDLDVAAREQCEEFGIGYNRIELPNLDPLFIRALAQISLKKI